MTLMVPGLPDVLTERLPHGYGGRFYGAYPALVTDLKDPDGIGRVKVSLPWSPDGSDTGYEAWARVATLMGGNDRGTWFIPDSNDEVLIVFAGGDPRHPYVIGGLWNGKDATPHQMDNGGNNDIKKIKSRSGVVITLDDTSGAEKFIAETPGGQRVTLKDGAGAVEIEDSNGNSIKLESAGITITASAKVTINAGTVALSAGMVTVDAGMSKFSGVVQCDTLISNSVVSSSYTPGAGNIW
jgi:uncharacterized protein involved in type VI secretion and phage assembly